MTETATGQQAAQQSVNGAAPAVAAEPEQDTGEKYLGVLLIAAGVFLLFIGIDRATGGRVMGALYGGDDGEG